MTVIQVAQEEVEFKITQLAFLNRFTDTEAIDIDLASIGETRQAAQLRHYLKKVSASTYIDLERPDLRSDLDTLVEFGLLQGYRVDQILDKNISPVEKYKSK